MIELFDDEQGAEIAHWYLVQFEKTMSIGNQAVGFS